MARRRSIVWKFFELIEHQRDGKTIKQAECTLYPDTVLTYAGGTSNLIHHLEAKHSVEYSKAKEGEVEEADRPTMKQTPLEVGPSVKKCSLARTKEINSALSDFIALDLRPIAVVDGTGFNRFLNCVEPGYVVPSRTFVMNCLKERYAAMKHKLQESFRLCDNLALTSDIWTSCATQAYVTITAHYITEDWRIQSYVLCTCEMPERHTGVNIATRLREVTEMWNIDDEHVSAVVTDNASNMSVAVDILEWNHLPCFAHTLQLAVNKGLDSNVLIQLSSLGRKLVSHFEYSSLATAALSHKQEQMNLPNHRLIQDVVTRWNSTFLMFQRLLEQRWAIYAVFYDEHGTQRQYKHLHLKEEQWNLMEQIVKVLEPLQITTTALCETEIVSCSLIYPVVNGLLKNHLLVDENDLPAVKRFREVVTLEIQNRFDVEDAVEEQSVAVFASILDPRYHQLKFLSNQIKTKAYSAFREKFASTIATEDCRIVEELSQVTSQGVSQPPKKKKKTALEILIGEDDDERSQSNKSSLAEEFNDYLRVVPLKSRANVLQWWSHNSAQFPNVVKLAKKYLCVPATSVPAEQVFSVAGEVINNKRSSLKPENVDMLVF